jgi:DNA-binding XRE family transcriptional regulator
VVRGPGSATISQSPRLRTLPRMLPCEQCSAAGITLRLQFRDARVSRGLTQAELSGLTGIPQADISRIERGAGNPTESTMQRLAHALNGRLQLVTA